MFDILSGEIEFYPGWKVHGERPMRAPSLKQMPPKSGVSGIEEIMTEMYVKPEVQKDLADMMKFITIHNPLKQER